MDKSKQIMLDKVASLINKISAVVLWKYTDEEGKDFYLSEKRVGTIKSPYSGKSFTPKPTKSSLSDVGKELKEDDAKVKGALWKYVDDEGSEFYLSERITGTIKSPYSGKSFTPKAEKSTLSDVGKELKQEKTAADKLALNIVESGEGHQAFEVIKKAYNELLEEISKISAVVLWKYTDEEGKDFYLSEKKVGTIKSPYSGKSFTPKPTKSSLSDVGKELKEDDAKIKGALWKYVDDEGSAFYLSERITGTIKSPYSGKSFTPKAEKSTLSDVGKELKQSRDNRLYLLDEIQPKVANLGIVAVYVAEQMKNRLGDNQ
jgi:predicted transcriptional regulator with HTH domain